MARPHLSTTGLLDDKDDEDAEFQEDLIDEIEDLIGNLKRKNLGDYDLSEKIRIALRKDIFEVLRIKAKVSVHLTRI